jgi:hypothetical protein
MSYFNWDENFALNVARGKVRGAAVRNIFGFNASIGTTMRTVWELADTTAYVFPTSALPMTIASDIGTTADDGVQVRIVGLDANYAEISQTVTINNATPPVTQGFFRINDMITASGNATGNITAKNNGVTYARITAGTGRNQAAIYSVPAGCQFYLMRIDAFMNDGSSAKPGQFRNKVTLPNGTILRVADTPYINQMNILRRIPFKYDEKTDIELQIKSLSGTNLAGVFGEGIVIKEQ